MNKEGKWHLDEDVDWMRNEMAVLKDWLKTCLDDLRDASGQLRGLGSGIKEVQATIRLKREL